MGGAKVGQGMGAYFLGSRQPHVSRIIAAPFFNLAARSKALGVAIQPYANQQTGIVGRPPGLGFHRFDVFVERLQITLSEQFPQGARRVVGIHQVLYIEGAHHQLVTLHRFDPHRSLVLGLLFFGAQPQMHLRQERRLVLQFYPWGFIFHDWASVCLRRDGDAECAGWLCPQ